MRHAFLYGCCLLVTIIFVTAFIQPSTKTKIILVGDSTMSIKETKAYPETGWGMPFSFFWDSTVQVINLAKNGRSTKSFIQEGLWDKAMKETRAGDYVFIQFGHNDEAKEKIERYTTPEQYVANLEKMVTETKQMKATPVLLTPVSRRKFDSVGNALNTHGVYSNLVKQVATTTKTVLIDLDEQSKQLYQTMGKENSKLLFLQLQKNEHPNYPDGKEDNTHFNELGARLIAQIVLKNIQQLQLPLATHIVVPIKK